MFIGNIVTTDKIVLEEEFKIVSSITECIPNLPILIIGWKQTKDTIDGVSILRKHITKNTYWTFTPSERKVEYEQDIEDFKTLCYNNIGTHLHYVYIDPIHTNKTTIKKILYKIYSFNKSISYISEGNMLYIHEENLVFGVDLNIMELIGIDKSKILTKIQTLPQSVLIRKQVFNKCKSLVTKINKNNKILPYIYRYGECSEDNHSSLFCS